MTVWRYTAIPVKSADTTRRRGELAGESASDVRAALRRVGLQVIDLRPIGRRVGTGRLEGALGGLLSSWRRHLRARRRVLVGEFYDSLATMLDAGVPLLEAVSTIAGGGDERASRRRAMLLGTCESLRGGASLAESMSAHPAWFDGAEIAMVAAGQHTGELARVLRTLAERHERSGELSGKLAAALAYPAIVAAVGLGVVIFLSTKTLPDLAEILNGAGVRTPALTSGVMAFGEAVVAYGPALLLVAITLMALFLVFRSRLAVGALARALGSGRLTPRVVRQASVAEVTLGLAEMAETGVPVVESLRVLAPTVSGYGRGGLGALLLDAAARIERGETLSSSLDDEQWFDAESRRLIQIGESSGEMPDVLRQVGERKRRAARRSIDRLASLLEPAVILVLASLVGIVVLSAVLPLIRLQEILG